VAARTVVRILGIDPGSRRTGWGLIAVEGSRLIPLGCGVITVPPRAPFAERLLLIHEELRRTIEKLQPTEVAVEDVFHSLNARTALALGHARGAALVAAAGARLPVRAYSPATVKKSVVGSGRAGKPQVGWMVNRLLGLKLGPSAVDATDALAVALCRAAHLRDPRDGA